MPRDQQTVPAEVAEVIAPAANALVAPAGPRPGLASRFARRRLAVLSLVVLGLVVVVSFAGGLFYPYDHTELTKDFSQGPSSEHWMGTDAIGHDLFAQVLQGTQKSLSIALLVALLATSVGVALGTMAGYYRGWIDTILSRLTDLILVVPILAVLLAAANAVSQQAGNWWMVALLLSAFLWPGVALVVRSTVLSLRERDFIQAQRAAGATDLRIIVRHIIPNAVGPILVSATLLVVTAILLESSLAFLGFGVAPPDSSLGKLVAVGQPASTNRPWLFYFPGVVLLVICLCLNFVGDGLRGALDPRSTRGRR